MGDVETAEDAEIITLVEGARIIQILLHKIILGIGLTEISITTELVKYKYYQ